MQADTIRQALANAKSARKHGAAEPKDLFYVVAARKGGLHSGGECRRVKCPRKRHEPPDPTGRARRAALDFGQLIDAHESGPVGALLGRRDRQWGHLAESATDFEPTVDWLNRRLVKMLLQQLDDDAKRKP